MQKYFIIIIIAGCIFGSVSSKQVFAQQRDTDLIQSEIENLESEIKKYQQQANQIASQAVTLESSLRTIETNQKKLQSQITLTSRKINQANTTIQRNEQRITNLLSGIDSNTLAVEELFRSTYQDQNRGLIEFLVGNETLSSFLDSITQAINLRTKFQNQVSIMIDTKTTLEQAQNDLADETQKLQKLKGELDDQERIVALQKKDQQDLVFETKNQESAFRSLIADRQAKRDTLDAEIRSFESQLEFDLDIATLPQPGSQVLAWPLRDIFVTQRFGRTVAAQRLYVSGSHSGTDFRAAVGTPVYAVADGIVEGVGDTDLTCSRASFGKWVFIRHYNGLATAYGHLSLIKATEGSRVTKGELIGYSGNTGYSTGPHLHITVYASNGVNGSEGARIADRPSKACPGKVFRMPIAPTVAYLDPLLYLPPLSADKFKTGLR